MNKEQEIEIRANFEEALTDFNFEKVHDVMEYLNWYWWGKDRAPTIREMIKNADQLFDAAIDGFDGGEVAITSGGFLVRIRDRGDVEIQFILEHS